MSTCDNGCGEKARFCLSEIPTQGLNDMRLDNNAYWVFCSVVCMAEYVKNHHDRFET